MTASPRNSDILSISITSLSSSSFLNPINALLINNALPKIINRKIPGIISAWKACNRTLSPTKFSGIEKNNKIVINPLGDRNNSGHVDVRSVGKRTKKRTIYIVPNNTILMIITSIFNSDSSDT